MRGNQAVFSVILAHYCQPDYWKDAVDSVLNQDYPAIELIFADDGTPGFCGFKSSQIRRMWEQFGI